MWSTVFCPIAGPLVPVVAHQALLDGQRGCLQHLALLGDGPTDYQLQGALAGRRPPHLGQADLQLRNGHVFHQPILPGGGAASAPGDATLGTW